jgi:hypothetical protein
VDLQTNVIGKGLLLQTGASQNGAPQQSKVLPISATASSDFGASHHANCRSWFIASEEILTDNFYRLFAITESFWRSPEVFCSAC